MYRICPFFDLLDNNSVCCEVEIKKEEETLFEMNFFMCLVLVGLLVVIYAIVSLVFCICPSGEYKSIDEMLTKMPDDQVKVLKEMVRNERNSMKEKEVIFSFCVYLLNLYKLNFNDLFKKTIQRHIVTMDLKTLAQFLMQMIHMV